MKRLLPVLLAVLAWGCASDAGRFADGAREPLPEALAAEPHSVPQGRQLTWGGTVIAVRNLSDRTVLEVLAYPLDRRGRPEVDAEARGRFLVDRAGFLEPRDYRPGRSVTASGPLLGYQDGRVGSADYRFPVLSGERLELWDRAVARGYRTSPRVGVGVGIGNHGSSVGIGLGF